MNKITDGKFTFIETGEMPRDRVKLGWKEEEKPGFVVKYNSGLLTSINEADVVIFGAAPYSLIKERILDDKLTFVYSERIFKTNFSWIKKLYYTWFYTKRYPRKKKVFLLSASAFSYVDYYTLHTMKNKAYKWGYFPAVKQYDDIKKIVDNKTEASILWVGRLINLKHPELSLRVAEKLKNDGYKFVLDIIGNGEMEENLKDLAEEKGLSGCVNFLGSMGPNEVREHMEKAQIFLFTSDFNEGWGAVLNESMNSACAVVASHAIGSVPFLIKDGQNGIIYKNEDDEDLYKKVKNLLDHPEKCKGLGTNAYLTLRDCWNAGVATKRLIELVDDIQKEGKSDRFKDGPCSKAKIVRNNWYKK